MKFSLYCLCFCLSINAMYSQTFPEVSIEARHAKSKKLEFYPSDFFADLGGDIETQTGKLKENKASFTTKDSYPKLYDLHLKPMGITFYMIKEADLKISIDYSQANPKPIFTGRGAKEAAFYFDYYYAFEKQEERILHQRKTLTLESYQKLVNEVYQNKMTYLKTYIAEVPFDSIAKLFFEQQFLMERNNDLLQYITENNPDIQQQGLEPAQEKIFEQIRTSDLSPRLHHPPNEYGYLLDNIIRLKKDLQIYAGVLPPAKMDSVHWILRTYALGFQEFELEAFQYFSLQILLPFTNPITGPLLKPLYDHYLPFARADHKNRLQNALKRLRKEVAEAKISEGAILEEIKIKTIADLTQQFKGKVLYLDFWASWCGPCIQEIPNSQYLSAKLDKEEARVLYISFDEHTDMWKSAISKHQILGQHYKLDEASRKAMFKEFGLSSVPRYMLINKDGDMINSDAPPPSDHKIMETINQLISNK